MGDGELQKLHLIVPKGGWLIQARFWLEWGSSTTGLEWATLQFYLSFPLSNYLQISFDLDLRNQR